MEIFIDATVLQIPATGIAKSTLNLYYECIKKTSNLNITLVHQRKIQSQIQEDIKNVQCGKYISNKSWRKYYLPFYLKRNKPQAIHFPWNGNVPNKIYNTKVITTINDVLPLSIPNYFNNSNCEKLYLEKVQNDINRTDLLITISEYSKKEIIKHFKVKTPPVVIPLGPSINNIYNNTANVNKEDYFIYVGGYDRRKGIDKLLQVFINLHLEKKIKSKLILTGTINHFSAQIIELINKCYNMNIIEEKGYVTDRDLYLLMKNAKALIYPSKYEGFGLPPLDAMSIGCPVITTKSSSIPEICGDAVYYIDPDNLKEFANGINQFENNSNLMNDLKNKGLKQAQKYTWEKAANTYIQALKAIEINL